MHRGVLLQNVFLLGISSFFGYFQIIMDYLTYDLLGVAVYLNDIVVSGKKWQGPLLQSPTTAELLTWQRFAMQ